MTLFEMVCELRTRGPRCAEAYRSTVHYLRPIAVRRLGPNYVAHADDAVQDVVAILISDRRSLDAITDANCRSYLFIMVRNKCEDLRREHLRALETRPATRKAPAPDGDPPDANDALANTENEKEWEAELERALSLLERVYRAELAARAPQHRGSFERSWSQAWALSRREATMQSILERDEGVEPNTDDTARRRARDRVLKAQERLRKDLIERGKALLAAGEVSPEELRLVTLGISCLLRRRRQKASRKDVSGEETAAQS